MKKSLLALAVLGAFAGAASAQSSVTLFGVVDLSANDIKNGNAHTQSLQSNQLNSNRLGFRGIEDLGGGLKAGFWLEAAMNNENGNMGGSSGITTPGAGVSQIFNRRSTVSLFSNWGELRLGRDYDAIVLEPGVRRRQRRQRPRPGPEPRSRPEQRRQLAGSRQRHDRVPAAGEHRWPVRPGAGLRAVEQLGQRHRGDEPEVLRRPSRLRRRSLRRERVVRRDGANAFNNDSVATSSRSGTPAVRGTSASSRSTASTTRSSSRAFKADTYEISASVPLGQGEFRAVYGHVDQKGSQPICARVCVNPAPSRRASTPTTPTCGRWSTCTTCRSGPRCTPRSARSRTRARRRSTVLPGTATDAALARRQVDGLQPRHSPLVLIADLRISTTSRPSGRLFLARRDRVRAAANPWFPVCARHGICGNIAV